MNVLYRSFFRRRAERESGREREKEKKNKIFHPLFLIFENPHYFYFARSFLPVRFVIKFPVVYSQDGTSLLIDLLSRLGLSCPVLSYFITLFFYPVLSCSYDE